jgi:hypothetical protein
VTIQFFHNSATPATYSGETGDTFARVTDLRIKGTTSATVTVGEIATALNSYVASVNPSMVQATGAGIGSAAAVDDLRGQIYEDARPSEILTRLCQIANLRWQVGADKTLRIATVGTGGKTYYVDANDIEMQSSADALFNSSYAVYRNSNRTLRTDAATNGGLITRWGITRQSVTRADTESEAEAEQWRDALLDDQSGQGLRARVRFERVLNASGEIVEKYLLRADDTIVIRNLPPDIGEGVDNIRTFIIERTDYDTEADEVTVEPFVPRPSLVSLISRRENVR